MDKLKQQIKTHYDTIAPSGEFMDRLAAMKAPAHKSRGYLFAVAAMLALMIGGAFVWKQVSAPQAADPAPITMQHAPVQAAPAPAPDAVPKKPEAPAQPTPKPVQKPAPAEPEQPEAAAPVQPAPAAPAETPKNESPRPADSGISDPAEPIPEESTDPVPVEPPKDDDPSEIDDPPEDNDPPEELPKDELQATYEGGIVTLTNASGEQATIDVSEQFNQRTYYGVFTVFGEQIDIFLYPDESSEAAVLAGYLDEPLKK